MQKLGTRLAFFIFPVSIILYQLCFLKTLNSNSLPIKLWTFAVRIFENSVIWYFPFHINRMFLLSFSIAFFFIYIILHFYLTSCGWKQLKLPAHSVSQISEIIIIRKCSLTLFLYLLVSPIDKEQLGQQNQSVLFDRYTEDDDTTTDTGRTMSSVADSHRDSPPFLLNNENNQESSFASFEQSMIDPENGRVSRYQNTYFMDGGNRFISVRTERGQSVGLIFFSPGIFFYF